MGYMADDMAAVRNKPKAVSYAKSDDVATRPRVSQPAPQYGADIGAAPVYRVAVPARTVTGDKYVAPTIARTVTQPYVPPTQQTVAAPAPTAGGATIEGGTLVDPGTTTSLIDPEVDAAKAAAEAALQAQLNAIAEQFGMTREQLAADQGEAGRQYTLLAAQLLKQFNLQLKAIDDDAVTRGILQSGNVLEDQAIAQGNYGEADAIALGDRDRQLADLARQIAYLKPAEEAAKAQAKMGNARQILDLESMRAMYGNGLAA